MGVGVGTVSTRPQVRKNARVSGAVSVQALMGGGQHYRSGATDGGGGTEQRQVNAPIR